MPLGIHTTSGGQEHWATTDSVDDGSATERDDQTPECEDTVDNELSGAVGNANAVHDLGEVV